jgi:hypothetical protein
MLGLLLLVAQGETACTGRGDSTHDWLVAGCADTASFSASSHPDGSVVCVGSCIWLEMMKEHVCCDVQYTCSFTVPLGWLPASVGC